MVVWRKVACMKYARSPPILGICEISSDYLITRNQQNWQDRCLLRSQAGGVSDVYEGPHSLSAKHQFRSLLDENEVLFIAQLKAIQVYQA